MPYWGANVRSDSYVIQAKVHGQTGIQPASADLKEYMTNLIRFKNVAEESLAPFFAEKIATAFQGFDKALWVTVDVLTTEGNTFGETRMIKEIEQIEQASL